MTDGERLIWAVSFAIALEFGGDSTAAVRSATAAITELRDIASRRGPDGFVISQTDEREFVDEMVSAP